MTSTIISSDTDLNLNFFLTGSAASRYNGSNYGSFSGVIFTITSSVINQTLKKIETFVSGGKTIRITSPATVTEHQPTGWLNSKYIGTKMTSAGFNVNSPDTYDGKPVVEIIIVNPNSIKLNPSFPIIPDAWLNQNPFNPNPPLFDSQF